MATVLKFACEGDIRRTRIASVTLESLQEALRAAFPDLTTEGRVNLKYLDDEGDLCVITPLTFADFVALHQGAAVVRLEVCLPGPAPLPAAGEEEEAGPVPMMDEVASSVEEAPPDAAAAAAAATTGSGGAPASAGVGSEITTLGSAVAALGSAVAGKGWHHWCPWGPKGLDKGLARAFGKGHGGRCGAGFPPAAAAWALDDSSSSESSSGSSSGKDARRAWKASCKEAKQRRKMELKAAKKEWKLKKKALKREHKAQLEKFRLARKAHAPPAAPSASSASTAAATAAALEEALGLLASMGFGDEGLNRQLLQAYSGDVQAALEQLL
jgi:hypothetical protein